MKFSHLPFVAALVSLPAAATPPQDFEQDSFYKITTVVNGQELALTFVLPGDACRKDAQTSCPSKARVELQKFKNEPTQLWRPENQMDNGRAYSVFSKYSDHESDLTGTLLVSNPDNRFLEDKAYKEKHNRLTVGLHTTESNAMWSLVKQDNGKYRITSLIEVTGPKDEPYPSKWKEPRSLEGYKTPEGKFEVRNAKNADVPAQLWAITKVSP